MPDTSSTPTSSKSDLPTQADPLRTPGQQIIGVLGGMSPESTADYYQRINADVRERLGSFHSARMLIHSTDLQQVFDWTDADDHDGLGAHLVAAARALEGAGADFVIMACNTAHAVAPQIESALGIPFVHIADVLGEALRDAGCRRVGLLASRHTTELPFYEERLWQGFGIETVVPEAEERSEVDRVIREELCFHRILPASRERFERITGGLKGRGADAVALACTEIGLLIDSPTLAGLPVFDTTALHCRRAVELALAPTSARSTARRSSAA